MLHVTILLYNLHKSEYIDIECVILLCFCEPQLASVGHVEAGAEVVAEDGCWPPLLADGEARLLVLHQLDAVCLDVLLHVVSLDKPPEQNSQNNIFREIWKIKKY